MALQNASVVAPWTAFFVLLLISLHIHSLVLLIWRNHRSQHRWRLSVALTARSTFRGASSGSDIELLGEMLAKSPHFELEAAAVVLVCGSHVSLAFGVSFKAEHSSCGIWV